MPIRKTGMSIIETLELKEEIKALKSQHEKEMKKLRGEIKKLVADQNLKTAQISDAVNHTKKYYDKYIEEIIALKKELGEKDRENRELMKEVLIFNRYTQKGRIDKKTREKIVKLLFKRKKRMGHKHLDVVDIHHDLEWICGHMGEILESLKKQGLIKQD